MLCLRKWSAGCPMRICITECMLICKAPTHPPPPPPKLHKHFNGCHVPLLGDRIL